MMITVIIQGFNETMLIQLLEELRGKQKQEAKMQADLESLKQSLASEKQNFKEVTCERDRLKSSCDEKDNALQVSVINFLGSFFALNFALNFLIDSKSIRLHS